MHPTDVKVSLSNEINVIRFKDGKQKIYFISPVFSSLPPRNSAIICSSLCRGQWGHPAFCGVCPDMWTRVTASAFPLVDGKMLSPLQF